MRIDHRCPDIGMTEERLDGAEIVPCLQQVRGMTMTESVRSYALCQFRLSDRLI